MNARGYLSQAYRLDQRINSKIEQLANLNDLATKCTQVITGMPGSPNKGNDKLGNVVAKIVDLQLEINDDIDKLVDLKREIMEAIKGVENPEYQTLLELRYLCYKTWEQIAVDMGYSSRNVRFLRAKAFEAVKVPKQSLQ